MKSTTKNITLFSLCIVAAGAIFVLKNLQASTYNLNLEKYPAKRYELKLNIRHGNEFALGLPHDPEIFWKVTKVENLKTLAQHEEKSPSKKFKSKTLVDLKSEHPGRATVTIQLARKSGKLLVGTQKTFAFVIK